MGCLTGIAKYLLFLFNFLITICGIVLVVFGALVIAAQNQKDVDTFIPYHLGEFAIAVGVIIFLIAFFGCCGAIKESSCLLLTYAIILVILLVIQIVLGALAFVAINKNGLEPEVNKAIKKIFDEYPSSKAMDSVQQAFKCCGKYSPADWALKLSVPPSSCYENEKTNEGLFPIGCVRKITDYVEDKSTTIGYIAIIFGVVELLGAIFAFMVRHNSS